MRSPHHALAPALALALALSACSDAECNCIDEQPDAGQASDSGPASDAGSVDGALVFNEPAPGGNAFACSDCHALDEAPTDDFRRVALPLGTAAQRPSFHGGALDSLHDAVNVCMSAWMEAEPFSATDPRWLGLQAFLEGEAGSAPASAEPMTIAELPGDTSGGDATRGEALFGRTCAACHGPEALGTELAPALAGMHLPGMFIAQRVRRGGPRNSDIYEGLNGGRMPFWAAERLSDDELLDVIAFVEGGAGASP